MGQRRSVHLNAMEQNAVQGQAKGDGERIFHRAFAPALLAAVLAAIIAPAAAWLAVRGRFPFPRIFDRVAMAASTVDERRPIHVASGQTSRHLRRGSKLWRVSYETTG